MGPQNLLQKLRFVRYPPFMHWEHVELLVKKGVAGERDLALFHLLFYAGLKPGQIVSNNSTSEGLKVKDLDLVRARLTVQDLQLDLTDSDTLFALDKYSRIRGRGPRGPGRPVTRREPGEYLFDLTIWGLERCVRMWLYSSGQGRLFKDLKPMDLYKLRIVCLEGEHFNTVAEAERLIRENAPRRLKQSHI